MPRFAPDEAEKKPAPQPRQEAQVPAEPELRPVPASVFDDDFFRASERPERQVVSSFTLAEETVRVDAGVRETAYVATPEAVQREVAAMPESQSRVGFNAPAVQPVDAQEPDELDIPAFLRRGH